MKADMLSRGRFPGVPLWVTEYNVNQQPLDVTQAIYKQKTEYMDRLPEVERYALFGAFRSDVSNIGPNGTMVNDEGDLTTIGMWYLGKNGTGACPVMHSGGLSQTMPGHITFIAVGFALISTMMMFCIL